MLRILGSQNPFREGFHRREVLQAGGLSGLSLGLSQFLRWREASATETPAPAFGRAKRILLVYLQGAASQFETWDPKPDAPAEIRGFCGATSTSVPGTFICDGLPKLARLMDRVTLVRSMNHDHNNHSNVYTLTGHAAVDFSSETNPFDPRHHPFFMSVLDFLRESRGAESRAEVPRNIALPYRFSKFAPVSRRAGPYATFLGPAFDPVWTEFDGKATQSVARVSFFKALKDVVVADPYLGIAPEGRLRVTRAAQLRRGMTLDRLNDRVSLRDQLEQGQRSLDHVGSAAGLDRFETMAHSLITSSQLREALELSHEPTKVREAYGMNLFGQSALTARRLLEAGSTLVSLFWDEYKVVNTAWDTHFRHETRLRDELHPGLDAGLSSLLLDLEDRGMLDDTLVLCLTEHGRTPRISEEKRGGGRNHWSNAYSILLAGAGIRRGHVCGASDAQGGFVKDDPVTPEDILASTYYLAGINPEQAILDRLQRPVKLTASGRVLQQLFA